MARVSYLARREGRYYLQVRCSHVAGLLNQPLFRTSLRTADYRQARRRVAECLGWVYGMNDSIDFAALFAKNVRQLQTYLSDPLPLSDDRLFARRSYEEMLKNLNRRAQARDSDPNVPVGMAGRLPTQPKPPTPLRSESESSRTATIV